MSRQDRMGFRVRRTGSARADGTLLHAQFPRRARTCAHRRTNPPMAHPPWPMDPRQRTAARSRTSDRRSRWPTGGRDPGSGPVLGRRSHFEEVSHQFCIAAGRGNAYKLVGVQFAADYLRCHYLRDFPGEYHIVDSICCVYICIFGV